MTISGCPCERATGTVSSVLQTTEAKKTFTATGGIARFEKRRMDSSLRSFFP